MRVSAIYQKLLLAAMALMIACAVVQLPFVFARTQPEPERFWLAGRYDGNRVIVYFDSVQFDNKLPSDAREIAEAVAPEFLPPVELSADDIAQFVKGPDAERFALGQEYDLLGGRGNLIPVTLTTVVAYAGDEGTGNDSYIGALASPISKDYWLEAAQYYAVRRHRPTPAPDPKAKLKAAEEYAGLWDEPVRFDLQTKIISLVTQRAMAMATEVQKRQIQSDSPAFAVQSFRVAGGELRYYARAEWSSGRKWNGTPLPDFALGAWLTPQPELRVLATEKSTSGTGFGAELPRLLNVVDLDEGETGAIVVFSGYESFALELVKYQDGLDLSHMRVLQSIGAGE